MLNFLKKFFLKKNTRVSNFRGGRYGVTNNISKNKILKLRNSNIEILQFSEPVLDESVWENIENILLPVKPNLTLRCFGFYGGDMNCDLSFLKYLPSLRRLYVDCLHDCDNLEKICLLNNLEELHVGVYNLESLEFLNGVNKDLKKLIIGQTKSKKPTISHISRFSQLEYLYIEGHHKGIEAIAKLKNLQQIVLRSISTKDLSYLKGLDDLWSVDVKLGGITNFDDLSSIKNLRHLELWRIRGLSDLGFISSLKNLEFLFLQDLRNVIELPNLGENKKLKKIVFANLKGFKNIEKLSTAQNLEDFSYTSCRQFEPEDFIPLLKKESLKFIGGGFGSNKKNKKFYEYIKFYGKESNIDYDAFSKIFEKVK